MVEQYCNIQFSRFNSYQVPCRGLVCEGLSVPGTKRLAPELTLFPNPVRDVVNIKSSSAIESLAIYDATGRLVGEYSGLNNYAYRINTAGLSTGFYFVKAKFVNDDDHMPVVKRIVIE